MGLGKFPTLSVFFCERVFLKVGLTEEHWTGLDVILAMNPLKHSVWTHVVKWGQNMVKTEFR